MSKLSNKALIAAGNRTLEWKQCWGACRRSWFGYNNSIPSIKNLYLPADKSLSNKYG